MAKKGKKPSKYTDEQKIKALALEKEVGAVQATERTGVPVGTIRAWKREKRLIDRDPNNPQFQSNYKAVDHEVIERSKEILDEVKDEVREALVERLSDKVEKMADGLYKVVEEAIEEISNVLAEGPLEKEARGLWLRAVVGVIAQGVEKHQLLMGKPTGRFESNNRETKRYEYDVLQRIEYYNDVFSKIARSQETGEYSPFEGSLQGNDLGQSLDSQDPDTKTSRIPPLRR